MGVELAGHFIGQVVIQLAKWRNSILDREQHERRLRGMRALA